MGPALRLVQAARQPKQWNTRVNADYEGNETPTARGHTKTSLHDSFQTQLVRSPTNSIISQTRFKTITNCLK